MMGFTKLPIQANEIEVISQTFPKPRKEKFDERDSGQIL
jgi:hypothetical protein